MLNFSDVSTLEHELAETTLSNSPTDSLWQSSVQQHAVPDELLAFGALAQLQLLLQGLRVDTNTHRRQLEGHFQKWVPDEKITVHTKSSVGTGGDPVIIIGSTTVVTEFAVLFLSADSHEEDSTVFLADDIFTLLRGGIGVLLQHLVGRDEGDFLGEEDLHSVLFADKLVGVIDGLVDISDGCLEGVDVAILILDYLFPVPLIDIEGVGEVDVVVATKTTEVGNDSLSSWDLVVVKSPTLPLGQRERNFKLWIEKAKVN